MDKELSWDGYIYSYNEKIFSNKTLDDKIPVQIKGHIDENSNEIIKKSIQFPMDLHILRNYYNDRGVLFFRIVVAKNKVEIFYNSLYPSKIKILLDEAERKTNKKQINVTLIKMNKTPEDIRRICKQFTFETRKQGSGMGQIVPKSVKLNDLYNIHTLNATAIETKNPIELMQRVSSGDVCFYASKLDSDVWYPVQIMQGQVIFISKQVEKQIKVAGITYYNEYKVLAGTDDSFIIMPSDNLTINFTDKKFKFELNTTLSELYNDSKFLLAIINNSEIYIGSTPVNYGNPLLNDRLKENTEIIIDLYELFKMVNMSLDINFKLLTEIDKRNISKLLDIYRRNENIIAGRIYNYNMEISEKLYPLLIYLEDDDTISFANRVYKSKYQGFINGDDGENYRVPMFSELRGNVLGYLYDYDLADLKQQVDNSEINEYTWEVINISSIGWIEAYDINGNIELLKFALYILDKILFFFPDKTNAVLNRIQIRKRMGIMDDVDEHKLIKMKRTETDYQSLCGIYLLLDDKEKAKNMFDKLSDDTKDTFKSYPIFKFML